MFHQDLPIESSEQDIFNRSNYAKNLAEALLTSQYKSSFVVGLYGEWGSGKTSLCNMILEKIREEIKNRDKNIPIVVKQTINSKRFTKEEQIIIFQFNPWLCSEPNQLINQFFIQMANQFMENEVNCSIFNSILKYNKVISSSFVGSSSLFKLLITIIFKITTDIQSIKNKFIQLMHDENIKLFITIDDIDRLSEQEIVAVFQLVKALGDFPNTIYFLCFDYNIVTTALNNIHENKGKEYLEKIVQLPVSMPKIKTIDLENIFIYQLENIATIKEKESLNDQERKNYWVELFNFGIKFYLNSLRDINRFMNTFSLVHQQVGEETDFIDLVGITCLQVFEPKLHSLLPYWKYKFFAYILSDDERKKHVEDCQKFVNNFLEQPVITTRREAAKFILEHLFAGILTPFLKEEKNRRNKKIVYKESFDRYFSCSLHHTEISKVIMENILYNANEIEQFKLLENILKHHNFTEIIKEILSYYNENNKDNFPSLYQTQYLFKNLTLLWESFAQDEPGFFSIPEWLYYNEIGNLLFQTSSFNGCFSFLKNLFLNKEISLSMLSRIIINLKSEKKNTMIIPELLSELENIFIARSEQLLKSKEIFSMNVKIDFIWVLEEYEPEKTKKRVKELLLDFSFLAKFINSCTTYGSSFSGVFSQTIWSLSIYRLQTFLTNQETLEKATNFIQNKEFLNFDEKTQLNIIALYLNLSANINRTKDDHFSLDYTQLKTKLKEIKDNLK